MQNVCREVWETQVWEVGTNSNNEVNDERRPVKKVVASLNKSERNARPFTWHG